MYNMQFYGICYGMIGIKIKRPSKRNFISSSRGTKVFIALQFSRSIKTGNREALDEKPYIPLHALVRLYVYILHFITYYICSKSIITYTRLPPPGRQHREMFTILCLKLLPLHLQTCEHISYYI